MIKLTKKPSDAVNISELTVRTEPSPYYIPPKLTDIKKVFLANRLGYPPDNIDVVADVVNLLSGGKPKDVACIMEESAEWVADNTYRVSYDEDECRYEFERLRANSKKDMQDLMHKHRQNYHFNILSLLQKLDEEIGFARLPGNSPLQQAISLLRMIATKLQGPEYKNKGLSGMPGGISEAGFKTEKIVENIKEAIEAAEELTKEELELLYGGGKNPGDIEDDIEYTAVQSTIDMLGQIGVMDKVARNLNEISKMTVGRSYETKIDPAGRLIVPRPIQDFNSIAKLATNEWVYPKFYRNFRIISQKARIYERATTHAKKQLLYMLIDRSGSMRGGLKRFMAGGCVLRGLMGVMKDDAELYLRFFDSQCTPEIRVKTKDEAIGVMQSVIKEEYSGGSTRIATSARTCLKRIRTLVEEEHLSKPELLLVSDGEDGDDKQLILDDFPGIKFHAILLDASNDRIAKLARQTGGVGLTFASGDHS